MNDATNNIEDILDSQVCGFHQVILTPPVRLGFVSSNLCALLGLQKDELTDGREDRYAQLVHPGDRQKYSDFLRAVAEQEQSLTCDYRLLKKDGAVICVRDTLTPRRLPDGTLTASSVLTDITDVKSDEQRFLNDSIPCGFLKYTCEKQPKITYINQKMIELMRFPKVKDGEIDYLEMYKNDIFLMVPMEERRRFSKYLNRVYSADAPIAGEMTLLRCDGTRAHILGWVTKSVNEQGQAEFQSVCMDITDRYLARKQGENRRYLRALSDVYDSIFEFNLDADTVKCLHSRDFSSFKRFENIAMQIEDALERWLIVSVSPEEQESVRRFFLNYCQKKPRSDDGKPAKITYSALSSEGTVRQYTGVFIKVDESLSLYCCRAVREPDSSATLLSENTRLKEKMRDLVMQFSDGLAAFEVTPDRLVKPLYASENVCGFFGYTPEEWLALTERYTPLERFVAYSEASYDDFEELWKRGEAEFTYFDHRTETERKIKAICSEKEPDAASSRFVMLYSMEGNSAEEKSALPGDRKVSIRTFGYFDVFVGGSPMVFRNKKSKELLALLVDRQGGYVTPEEAVSFLWEDEPANTLTLSRYRKVALRLKNTLEEYGISGIVESVNGKRRLIPEKVDCDLYNYLSGKEEYARLFKGSYMTNYSWGETTLGELVSSQG